MPIASGGGYNNGQQFYNFLKNAANLSQGNTTNFINGLGGGLNYFGNIGDNWNVALSAAASDSHASIIQRPSIQTSQAKPAQFFVGNTVPYVTSTANYGGAYGNQSSYSQLSVGVELDVTPFINPDGLVVMDIQQEIDALNGYTTITGVGNIPNTIKRTLNSEIAVKNLDTVMLGGFIENEKSTSRSGVPLLQDIPLLGSLFSQRNNSKQREELIVLLRPTVLKTPEIAAQNTLTEERRLPGVSAAEAEDCRGAKQIDSSGAQKGIGASRDHVRRRLQYHRANQCTRGASIATRGDADDSRTNAPAASPGQQLFHAGAARRARRAAAMTHKPELNRSWHENFFTATNIGAGCCRTHGCLPAGWRSGFRTFRHPFGHLHAREQFADLHHQRNQPDLSSAHGRAGDQPAAGFSSDFEHQRQSGDCHGQQQRSGL